MLPERPYDTQGKPFCAIFIYLSISNGFIMVFILIASAVIHYRMWIGITKKSIKNCHDLKILYTNLTF